MCVGVCSARTEYCHLLAIGICSKLFFFHLISTFYLQEEKLALISRNASND